MRFIASHISPLTRHSQHQSIRCCWVNETSHLQINNHSIYLILLIGCAGLLVGHPFDTVKVSLQTQDFRKPIYSGTYDCVKKIIQRDSVKGLYRGLSSPMMSVSFINAILFGVYGNVQRRSSDPESLMTHFCAGAGSGLVQTLICSPMELVKSRLQVQHDMPDAKIKHAGPLSCLKHIWKTEGLRGVYRGFGITVVRDVPGEIYIKRTIEMQILTDLIYKFQDSPAILSHSNG